jgi:hypothetical protein
MKILMHWLIVLTGAAAASPASLLAQTAPTRPDTPGAIRLLATVHDIVALAWVLLRDALALLSEVVFASDWWLRLLG